MLFSKFTSVLLSAAATLSIALPNPKSNPDRSLPLPVHQIFDFGPNAWAENLAIRPNGEVLVSLLTTPEIWQIDPTRHQVGHVAHRFSNATSVFAVVENTPDVFYAIVGNFSTTAVKGQRGSYAIHELDFRSHGKALPKVRRVVSIPDAVALDGMALLNPARGLLLTGDTGTGQIYVVDTIAGTAKKAFFDPVFEPTPELEVGVNGIKIIDNVMYWSNGARGLFGRVHVNPNSGRNTSAVEVLLRAGQNLDDILVDENLGGYLSLIRTGLGYTRASHKSDANLTVIANLNGLTSIQFGRTRLDSSSLYATTTGNALANGANITKSGALSRIDVKQAGF